MSSILICSSPSQGHVAPLLTIAVGLVARGHRVRMLTGSRFRESVEAAGVTFLPLPPDADFDDRHLLEEFPGKAGKTGLAAMRFDFIEIFLRAVPGQDRAVREALADEPVDVVLVEPLFIGILPLLHDDRGSRPPVLALGIFPLPWPDPDVPPFGLGLKPLRGPLGRIRNRLLSRLIERVVFGPVQAAGQEVLTRITGRPLDSFVLSWPVRADGFVQLGVPEFEYPRSRSYPQLHFVGPLTQSVKGIDLPDWWPELSSGRPVVLVTQGTVANRDPDELITPAVLGLAESDALVIVTTGRSDGAQLLPEPLPSNVRVATFLPYDQLLPKVDVMVTNGGYGGVNFALRHGVPLVVAGATEDKMEVAARVNWSGVGIGLRTNHPSEKRLRRAIDKVLRDPAYAAASDRIGHAIGTASGIEGLITIIEDLDHPSEH